MVRKKFSKKGIAWGLTLFLGVVFILTFYIWHQVESIRVGYKTRELERQILQLKKEVEELEAKKSALLSLERVEKIAREDLQLVSPREDQIIYDEFDPNF